MSTLTVLLIAKDEESVIGQCLDSLWYTPVEGDVGIPRRPIWDELILIDTGSSDNTVEIAKAAGAKIGYFAWTNDFAEVRNFGETLATSDYVLWQDADDELVSGHAEIRAIVDANEECCVCPTYRVSVPQHLKGMDIPESEVGAEPRSEMLHKTNGLHLWKGTVQEYIVHTDGSKKRRVERAILQQEMERPAGDKPHSWVRYREEAADFSDRGLHYLAAEHGRLGHYAEAIALYEMSMRNPGSPTTMRVRSACMKGHIHHIMGDTQQATKAYLDAISMYPILAEPYFYLGEMFRNVGQLQLAEAWFSACQAFPLTDDAFQPNVYELRHDRLLHIGETRQERAMADVC